MTYQPEKYGKRQEFSKEARAVLEEAAALVDDWAARRSTSGNALIAAVAAWRSVSEPRDMEANPS